MKKYRGNIFYRCLSINRELTVWCKLNFCIKGILIYLIALSDFNFCFPWVIVGIYQTLLIHLIICSKSWNVHKKSTFVYSLRFENVFLTAVNLILVVIFIAVTIVTCIFCTYQIQCKAGLTVLQQTIHPLQNWG